ncbi:MAG: SRPBCC family protein [Gemmatimonadales bacterium]
MKVALIVLGVILGLGVTVALIGLLLPREHRATSAITLLQPVDSVWAAVRGLGEMPEYWSDLKSSERIPDINGHEAWAQSAGRNFTMRLEVEEEDPPRRLVTRIDAPPGAPFGGRWIYQLAPAEGGTRLTVTEDGWVANPVFRVMSRLMGYHRTMDSYLRALGGKYGETVTPEHLDAP